MVVEPRSQGTAIDKHKSPFRIRMVGNANFGISPAPRILLIQPSHHLPWNAIEGTELLLKVGKYLFVLIATLIVNGHASKLLVNR
jgi:hypothetical protein